MPVEFGVVTSTVANAAFVNFSYLSSGLQMPLDFGFVPTSCEFVGGTSSWSWHRGMAFGEAHIATSTAAITTAVAAVLDILDGSGVATTNMATTTVEGIGILIGTNTTVNPGSSLSYRGRAYK